MAAIGLAACGSEDAVKNPGDKVAARIMAGINHTQTRAEDSFWETDHIGVTVVSSPNSDMSSKYVNVHYSTSSAGENAEFSPVGENIFFQDARETVSFSAYAPYSETAGTDPSADEAAISFNTDDQSSRALQKKIDFIYAEGATASRTEPVVSFSGDKAFRHVMSRLVIEVRTSADDGFSIEEVFGGDYILGGLLHSGSFKPFKGIAEATGNAVSDWNLAKSSSVDDDASRIFSVIVAPQTLSAPLKFKAEIGGQLFVNETGLRPDLESGKSYKYTITVRKTGLTISGCTIIDWSDGGNFNGDATMPVPPIGDKPLENATIGDFYMKDGTLVDKEATLTDLQQSACIGIVFSTDKSRIGKGATEVLKEKGVEPHGLVLALTDAASETKWCYYSSHLDQNVDGNEGEPFKENVTTLKMMYRAVEGYSETKWIINKYSDSLEDDYMAFYHAGRYGTIEGGTGRYAAPESSTGWFIPAIGQLWTLAANLGGEYADQLRESQDSDKGYIYIDNAGTYIFKSINDVLDKVNGSAHMLHNKDYLASTERGSDTTFRFHENGYFNLDYLIKSRDTGYVRCILAF